MKTQIGKKESALAEFLELKPNEIVQSNYNDNQFKAEGAEYLVLTDSEADEMAKEYILDSVWAFNYSFLCAHSEAIAEIPEKEFKDMQGKLCESFNKAILAMIPDKDHFVDDAIACDGRGHFLSQYDGNEESQGAYYIYRVN